MAFSGEHPPERSEEEWSSAATPCWAASYHSKPVRLHRREELAGDVEARPIADDAVDSALGAKSGLPLSSLILVDPLDNLARSELRTAIEAATQCATSDLRTVVGRVLVRGLQVGREAGDPLLVIFLPAHRFPCLPNDTGVQRRTR